MLTLWIVMVKYYDDEPDDFPSLYTFWAEDENHAVDQWEDSGMDDREDVEDYCVHDTHIPYKEGN